MKNISKKLIGFLLQGILITIPLVATLYIVYRLFTAIDSIIPSEYPGVGLLILVASLTILGYLGTTIIAQPIMAYVQRLINKAPLLKSIYSAIRDLTTAFVGKKKSFNQPVLVRLSKSADIQKLGFITNKNLSELGISDGKVAVYLPHSYAFSGNLYIVPRENVEPLDAKSADVMKFIVSGGVTEVESE